MDILNKLRQKRQAVLQRLNDINDAVDSEKRSFSQEERTKCDDLLKEEKNLKSDIAREEKRQELQRELAGDALDGEQRNTAEGNKEKSIDEKQMDGFRSWIKTDVASAEFRDLQADVSTKGGFLVPSSFNQSLIKEMDNTVSIRSLATVHTVKNADSLGAVSLDNDIEDGDWTSEIDAGSSDESLSFGKRELKPSPIAKMIKISRTLLKRSLLPVDQIVRERLAYKYGVTEENAFLNGNGTNQPLGVFVASNDGIRSDRDISDGSTSSAFSADAFINAETNMKPQYLSKCRYILHRKTLGEVRKLKDKEDRYLLNVKDGTINGIPYILSEYAPSVIAPGAYFAILGDFSKYWIADALTLELQNLTELFAGKNQMGIIARKETDGAPVLSEAFTRLKYAD